MDEYECSTNFVAYMQGHVAQSVLREEGRLGRRFESCRVHGHSYSRFFFGRFKQSDVIVLIHCMVCKDM